MPTAGINPCHPFGLKNSGPQSGHQRQDSTAPDGGWRTPFGKKLAILHTITGKCRRLALRDHGPSLDPIGRL